ncbi:Hypothetical protein PBC10988_14990 [Planctomycetales bacterium 10988]|nr:Hypothetical protein PBC10988_14990 [Planctomycetales bacterium 10988]
MSSWRRTGCRTLWLLLAVCPLVGTLGFLLWTHRPGAARDWAQHWSQRLQVEVKIDSVSYPAPGIWVGKGIFLADPETGEEIARLRTLEGKQLGNDWLFIASQPRLVLSSPKLPRLLEQLRQSVRMKSSNSFIAHSKDPKSGYCEIWAKELTVQFEDASETWQEIVAWLEWLPERTACGMTIGPTAEGSNRPPILGEWAKDWSNDANAETLRITADGKTLPLWLSQVLTTEGLPSSQKVLFENSSARWQGEFVAITSEAATETRFHGVIEQLDLATIGLPWKRANCGGEATLEVTRFEQAQAKVKWLEGKLLANSGWIEAEALQQSPTPDRLYFEQSEPFPIEKVPFQQMGFAFQLINDRLKISANCLEEQGTWLVLENARSYQWKQPLELALQNDRATPQYFPTLAPQESFQEHVRYGKIHTLPEPSVAPVRRMADRAATQWK